MTIEVSDPMVTAVIQALEHGPRTPTEIEQRTGLARSRVMATLGFLIGSHQVAETIQGEILKYELASERDARAVSRPVRRRS